MYDPSVEVIVRMPSWLSGFFDRGWGCCVSGNLDFAALPESHGCSPWEDYAVRELLNRIQGLERGGAVEEIEKAVQELVHRGEAARAARLRETTLEFWRQAHQKLLWLRNEGLLPQEWSEDVTPNFCLDQEPAARASRRCLLEFRRSYLFAHARGGLVTSLPLLQEMISVYPKFYFLGRFVVPSWLELVPMDDPEAGRQIIEGDRKASEVLGPTAFEAQRAATLDRLGRLRAALEEFATLYAERGLRGAVPALERLLGRDPTALAPVLLWAREKLYRWWPGDAHRLRMDFPFSAEESEVLPGARTGANIVGGLAVNENEPFVREAIRLYTIALVTGGIDQVEPQLLDRLRERTGDNWSVCAMRRVVREWSRSPDEERELLLGVPVRRETILRRLPDLDQHVAIPADWWNFEDQLLS